MTDVCQFLPWDSAFFGVRIAKVVDQKINRDSAKAINTWCREQNIRCLYFLSAGDDQETVATAEEEGFHLVDIRVTMEQQLLPPKTAQPLPKNIAIRLAASSDLPALKALAGSAFSLSRFYFDPGFSRQHCSDLYQTWVEKSCAAANQFVLAAEVEGKIVGFISAEWEQKRIEYGKIGLLGVAQGMRGRGFGQHLMEHCLERLAGMGMRRIEAITQARNIGAQRVNQRTGFITRSVDLWYHKWI